MSYGWLKMVADSLPFTPSLGTLESELALGLVWTNRM